MATTSSISEDEKIYGREEVEPESEYSVLLRFPILYENAASDYDTNGLGALSDALTCIVNRTFNQFPTLQMTYKRNGIHAKDLQEGHIIMTDIGPDLIHQKFRINQIQKSTDNLIVNATHIAGDIAYNTITQDLQLPNASANDVFNTLINSLADPMPDIRFDTDVTTMSNVNMPMSSGNAGNLLIDADQEGDEPTQSMAALFKGEWVFDNYHYYLQQNGGRNTGIVIKYGRDLKTITQDTNIANTYTAIFPYATYEPAPAKATDSNEDWASIGGDGWIQKATATYAAGGAIDIYSSPVTGHRIIGQVTNGSHLTLVNKITDGQTLKDNKVVNTVNGDDWWYISNLGGWIDARWVTFDKSGDYLVNDAVGHYTVDIGTGSGRQTKYPFKGRGVVNYSGSKIHAYYSPFFGADKPGGDNSQGHVRTGDTASSGSYLNFDYKAINEKGDVWYRQAGRPHTWYYGPHISFSKAGTYIEDPTANGKAAIKSGAQKYVMKGGEIKPAPSSTKWVSTRTSKTKKYKTKRYTTKYHGKKINQKKTVKNKVYSKGRKKTVKATIKKGVYKIVGQIQYNGTTYYKTSNGTYVASSGVNWKDPMSYKPKTIDETVKGKWTDGKIEMYSEPKFGTAMNWAIPNGESFSTGPTAHGDGEDWTQCTYHGKTGWVLSKYLKVKKDEDFESYNPSDLESSDDTQTEDTNVDVADLTVKLPEGMLYADSAYGQEIARVQNVDLSSYFQHDYQDESGFNQTTGKYEVTQADIDQLRQLAQAYMKEHRFGEPNVSLTLTREQISDYQLDDIGLYDKVTVQFDQLGIYEEAEVTAATWDALAHRYTEITIGDLPISYEHELLKAADKNASLAVKKSSGHLTAQTNQLFGQMRKAVQSEGSDRVAQVHKIMDELEMYQKDKDGNPVLDKNGKKHYDVSYYTMNQQIAKIDAQIRENQAIIDQGGSAELQFWGKDSAGNSAQTFNQVYEIRAIGSDYIFKLNSNGIEWVDKQSGVARGLFDSNGYLAAQNIGAGEIDALTVNSATLNGALTVGSMPGMQVNVGTTKPINSRYSPDNGGNVIWVTSQNYSAMLSSGQLAIGESDFNGAQTIIHPSYISIGPDWNHVLTQDNFSSHAYYTIKTWVQGWVADYITVNGTRHTIWKGEDYNHASQMLP